MSWLRFFLIGVTLGASPLVGAADATESLRKFFNEVNTVQARFSQVVLDEAAKPLQESSGTLWIERPNRFRWDYDKPFQQQIVADGAKIWIYDKELNQVTVRTLSGGLSDTPAMLLAGKGKLEDKFTIKPLERPGEVAWVQLVPKSKDSGFDDIRLGFERGRLRVIEMVDGFGNTTRISLHEVKENARIGAATFAFTPPKGVDVIGE